LKRYLMASAFVVGIAAVYAVAQFALVPSASGTFLDARNTLSDAGFEVEAVDSSGERSFPHDLEVVVSQTPSPGSWRPFGSVVRLRTRVPRARAVVPNVVGQRLSRAATIVNDAGLMLDTGGWVPDDDIVASTVPAAGESVRFGSTVVYTLEDVP